MKKHSSRIGCYPGPKGSFADTLARDVFGAEPEYIDTVPEAFFYVDNGSLDYCVVPSETKMHVLTIVDRMFLETKNVLASKKIYVPIEFSLAGFCKKKEIEKIYSKEEAFEQCWKYLSKIPQAKKIKAGSTADMLQSISKKEAVICSVAAAEKYKIPVIEKNIATGLTSFLVLSRNDAEYKKGKKYSSSVIYGIDGVNEYGSLEKSLKNIFTKNEVNINSIISIPLKGKYAFSVWVDGHRNEENLRNSLEEAGKNAKFLRFCGSCEVERKVYKH